MLLHNYYVKAILTESISSCVCVFLNLYYANWNPDACGLLDVNSNQTNHLGAPISSYSGNEEVMITCHTKLVDEILTSILSKLRLEIKPCSNREDFPCTLWLNLDRPELYEGMDSSSTLILSLHLL